MHSKKSENHSENNEKHSKRIYNHPKKSEHISSPDLRKSEFHSYK